MAKLPDRPNSRKRRDLYRVREEREGYYISHPSFDHSDLGPLETTAQATALIRRLKGIARGAPMHLTPDELREREAVLVEVAARDAAAKRRLRDDGGVLLLAARRRRPALAVAVRGWARHPDLVLDDRARVNNRREYAELFAKEPPQRSRFEFPRQFYALMAAASAAIPELSWAPPSMPGGSEFGDCFLLDGRPWRALENDARTAGGRSLAAPIVADRAAAQKRLVSKLSQQSVFGVRWRRVGPALEEIRTPERSLGAELQLQVGAALGAVLCSPGTLVRLPPGKLRDRIATAVTEAVVDPKADRKRSREVELITLLRAAKRRAADSRAAGDTAQAVKLETLASEARALSRIKDPTPAEQGRLSELRAQLASARGESQVRPPLERSLDEPRERTPSGEPGFASSPAPEEEVLARLSVQEARARLKPEDDAVFELRDHGFTQEEIGIKLGMSRDQVKRAVARIRVLMRKHIAV